MSVDKLIEGLNEDLAAELGTIIRYNYQASQCYGPAGMGLRAMFAEEMLDEAGHARYLSDAIADLGGEPTTSPKLFDKPAGLKAMLELDIQLEEQDVASYVAHAELAGELGFVDLKMKLEEMAADEAGHARSLKRILKGL